MGGCKIAKFVKVSPSKVSHYTVLDGVVLCGYVSECCWFFSLDQIVFRSASCQMFLLIQISSEMWDFDTSGE